jgi:hypothetical protein
MNYHLLRSKLFANKLFSKRIITESYSQPAPEFEDQMFFSEDFQYPQYNMANSPSVSYNNRYQHYYEQQTAYMYSNSGQYFQNPQMPNLTNTKNSTSNQNHLLQNQLNGLISSAQPHQLGFVNSEPKRNKEQINALICWSVSLRGVSTSCNYSNTVLKSHKNRQKILE